MSPISHLTAAAGTAVSFVASTAGGLFRVISGGLGTASYFDKPDVDNGNQYDRLGKRRNTGADSAPPGGAPDAVQRQLSFGDGSNNKGQRSSSSSSASGSSNAAAAAAVDPSQCCVCQKKLSWRHRRHRCFRCLGLFCQKHGVTTHSQLSKCGVPGSCCCQHCAGQIGIGKTGGGGNSGKKKK
jgi:hypothetical protein